MQRRVLITAANGFGPQIIQAFQREGYDVFTIARNEDRKQSALAKNPYLPSDHILVCDLASDKALEPEFWKRLMADYHIGGVVNNAMVTPKNSVTKPTDKDQDRTYRVNTDMAITLFEACVANHIPVIQQSTHNAHIPNDDKDYYRDSKDLARVGLQKLVQHSGLKGIVIEPGMMATPGSGHYRMEVMAALPVKMVLRQRPGKLQPIAADDVTQAMIGMMRNLWEGRDDLITPGKVYQAAGHTSMKLEEYIAAIQEAMGIGNRIQLAVPVPLSAMRPVMNMNAQLNFPLGPTDGFDMQELQRDFSAPPEEVSAFMRAGNLTTLRDPVSDFRDYAEHTPPHTPLGAAAAYVGMDVERWLRSVKHEKWDSSALPLAGAPDPDIIEQAKAKPDRKRVLVVGGTGFMGPLMVQELLAAGHEVVCAVRSPEKAGKELVNCPGVEFIKADLNADLNAEVWKERLERYHIDSVVNNAGIEKDSPGQKLSNVNIKAPLALIEACRDLGKESGKSVRFVQISTGFLTAKDGDHFEYPRSKKEVENSLSKIDDLDWVVVRPNYVYEPGRGHILFEEVVKLPMLMFTKDGAKQPIFNRDLAIGVARLLEPDNKAHHSVLEAAGAETLDWRGMLGRVNDAMAENLKHTPHIHEGIASFMVKVNQKLSRPFLQSVAPYVKVDASTLAKVDPETFAMLCMGTHSNAKDWTQYTGCKPATIAEVYRAWKAGPDAYTEFCQQQRMQDHRMAVSDGSSHLSNVLSTRVAPQNKTRV